MIELKIKDMASVNDITRALLLNGYKIQSETIWKPFPRETSVDYFKISICQYSLDKEN